MVFRWIRYLVNNEKVIEKIANSYPIRRTAQWVVYVVTSGKYLSNVTSLRNNKFLNGKNSLLKNIKDNLEKKLKQ